MCLKDDKIKSVKFYKPIDYSSWNQAGQGKNIIHLLSPIEKKIWYESLPYQDKRNDSGHAEHVVYFALKLLGYIKAKRDIVIPAAILHDTGWSKLIPALFTRYNPFSDNFIKNKSKYRKLHQKASVEISKSILKKVNYPKIYVSAILEIISQHDTRKGFISPEDGVVRDADKLWRFTLRQFQMDYVIELTTKIFCKMRLEEIKKSYFFYSDISRQMARIELEHTMDNLRKNSQK